MASVDEAAMLGFCLTTQQMGNGFRTCFTTWHATTVTQQGTPFYIPGEHAIMSLAVLSPAGVSTDMRGQFANCTRAMTLKPSKKNPQFAFRKSSDRIERLAVGLRLAAKERA